MYSPYMFLVKGEPLTPPDKKTLALVFGIVAASVGVGVGVMKMCDCAPSPSQQSATPVAPKVK